MVLYFTVFVVLIIIIDDYESTNWAFMHMNASKEIMIYRIIRLIKYWSWTPFESQAPSTRFAKERLDEVAMSSLQKQLGLSGPKSQSVLQLKLKLKKNMAPMDN